MASSPTHRRPVSLLKRAIFDSGRNQKDIAADLGMHPSHLSRIVGGLHCDQGTRQKIAAALERNVCDLWPDEVALDDEQAAA